MEKWYALGADGNLYYLGECDDFDAAEKVAENKLECDVLWFVDKHSARQWSDTLKG